MTTFTYSSYPTLLRAGYIGLSQPSFGFMSKATHHSHALFSKKLFEASCKTNDPYVELDDSVIASIWDVPTVLTLATAALLQRGMAPSFDDESQRSSSVAMVVPPPPRDSTKQNGILVRSGPRIEVDKVHQRVGQRTIYACREWEQRSAANLIRRFEIAAILDQKLLVPVGSLTDIDYYCKPIDADRDFVIYHDERYSDLIEWERPFGA